MMAYVAQQDGKDNLCSCPRAVARPKANRHNDVRPIFHLAVADARHLSASNRAKWLAFDDYQLQ